MGTHASLFFLFLQVGTLFVTVDMGFVTSVSGVAFDAAQQLCSSAMYR